jgi:hypothetical protein
MMKKYKIKGFSRYLIDENLFIYNAKTGKKKKTTVTKDCVTITLYDDYLKRVNKSLLSFYELRIIE